MPYKKATTTTRKTAAKKPAKKAGFMPCPSCRTLAACKKAGKCKAKK